MVNQEDQLSYQKVYNDWKQDPLGFWKNQAKEITWYKAPDKILDDSKKPFYNWFTGGAINACYNCVDRHIENGKGEDIAIIYDSAMCKKVRKISYLELKQNVAKLAGALKGKGIKKGDRVIIYMPMIPEAVVAMLACARLGAIHSVVFGGFASSELAVRIDDCNAKAIIAGSCGLEPGRIVPYKPLLDEAISLAEHKPDFCIVYQRDELRADLIEGRDFDWNDLVSEADEADCVPVRGEDPLYILYTSGTTGQPKGVIRPVGGHLVSLNWTMKNFYDIHPGEVFWAASDVGWVVGHSYIVYAPLVSGTTSVLFEGKPVGTPDAGTFWRVISDHNVVSLFTAPTAFRAIKRADPKGNFLKKYSLTSLRTLFLAGERADPDTINWAKDLLQIPVIDHWWQTESGHVMIGNPWGIEKLEIKVGSPSVPIPGFEIDVLDENGNILPPNQLGSIAIKLPLAPGALPSLWKADDRFVSAYLSKFPGYYETGDAGLKDEDGYMYIMARTDDVINVAGHRLSTGAMEEILADHKDVAECAVVGISDELKGQVPLGLVCLTDGVNRPEGEVKKELVQMVRDRLGPVAFFKQALIIKRLPKTRSGKILRSTVCKIADGEEFKVPATIDDPLILEEIKEALAIIGYPRN